MSPSLWFRFLGLLSSIYTITHVSAYTKWATTALRVYDDWSGTYDDARSYASCTSTNFPTLISCGLASGDHHIDGSYVTSDGRCVAQNGIDNSGGVLAVALCATSDYTCSYHTGSQSGSGDDDTSKVGCSSDKIMISCAAQSSWSTIDGSYVGTKYESTAITSSTLCTAHNSGGSSVYAHGICCKYNRNDGYEFDCETKWGNAVSNGVSTASCDYGYSVFACMGYSLFSNTLAEYYRADSCRAESVSSSTVQAVATCCRLYKEPTSSPTEEPTPAPTNAPTSNPTPAPTFNPTAAPTDVPTASPTCAVHGDCASVTMHCDDQLTVYYAVNGEDFVQIATNKQWPIETRVFLQDININSVLQFSCENILGLGGFIASVDYKDIIYSTTKPLTAGGFQVISSSDGVLVPLIYTLKQSTPWFIDTETIAHNAYWIWNGGTLNTMIFEFRFDTIITASPTLDPTPKPTINPTSNPTTPAPSKPGTLSCGEQAVGDYNNVLLEFTVRMLYPGHLTFDTSQSLFNVTAISAVFGTLSVGSDSDFDGVLILNDLQFAGDYIFTIHADEGVRGKYNINIICESYAPTSSPTVDPTIEPTSDPTNEPTLEPTYDPTLAPTIDPTADPTVQPTTDNPTNSPTAAPTMTPTAAPTRSPAETLIVRPPSRPTYAEVGIETTFTTDGYYTSKYEATLSHDSGEKGEIQSLEDLDEETLVYIAIGMSVITLICVGCIVYYVIVILKRKKREAIKTVPNLTGNTSCSVGISDPVPNTKGGPGSASAVQGEGVRVELVALVPGGNVQNNVVDDIMDDDDLSDTSNDSIFDAHETRTAGALPLASDNRMEGPQASIPLPELPHEPSHTPGDSDSDPNDALYARVVTTKRAK